MPTERGKDKGEELDRLLRMWRAGADLSIEELTERVRALLPPGYAASDEKIRRNEKGIYPASGPDWLVIAATAVACGMQIGELPEEARRNVDLISQLLGTSWSLWSHLVKAA